MIRDIHCAHVLTAATVPAVRARTIRLDGERIAAVEPTRGPAEALLALPPFANAHDHARTVRSSSYGAAGKPLETWLHYLALPPAADPYLTSAVSLSCSALGGSGIVMVHYTRIQGPTDLPTEAKEVARAARDVGVRVGFAVAMRDRNPLVYGPSEPILGALPADARDEIERAVHPEPNAGRGAACTGRCGDAAAVHGPMFDVQYRAEWRAMGDPGAAPSRRRCLGAHRAAGPHASAGDTLSARLGRRGIPAGHRQISQHDRAAQPAPDARALHMGAAGRT